MRGVLEAAARNLAQALELHKRIGSAAGEAYVLSRQANLATARGDLQTGWALVNHGLDAAHRAAVRDHCLQRLYSAGIDNRLQAGDLPAATELAEAAQALEREGRVCPVCSVQVYPAVSACYLARGDAASAWDYAEKALRLAEAFHNRVGAAYALRAQGLVHSARGERAAAASCLRRAVEVFRELDQRYDLAKTLLAWADLPADGEPSLLENRQARLREAREILDKIRATAPSPA